MVKVHNKEVQKKKRTEKLHAKRRHWLQRVVSIVFDAVSLHYKVSLMGYTNTSAFNCSSILQVDWSIFFVFG